MKEKLVSIVIASGLGAIVIFFFGFFAFTIVESPSWFQRPFPADHPAVESLRGLESGMYVYPYPKTEEDMEKLEETMKAGPVFTIYLNSGSEFKMGLAMIEEYSRSFLAAVVVSFLLSLAYSNLCCYSHRVFFVALCGVFAATSCEPSYSIWYWRPCGATAWMYGATVISWTLAGLVIAAFVKPWNSSDAGPDNLDTTDIGK